MALSFGYRVRNLLDYSAIIERILRYTQNDKGFKQILHYVQYDRVIKHVGRHYLIELEDTVTIKP